MTTFERYPSGVPCWVDTIQPDIDAARRFYAALFGWTFHGPGPMPDGGAYYVARVGDKDVAGIGTLPASAGVPPAWTTYVRVANVDETAARIEAAGGRIIAPPFDALPAGRSAIAADSGGAIFGLWEAHEREGAQLVNAPSAWAMSVLQTHNVGGATGFYETVFGWKSEPFEFGGATITMFRLPGYVGGKEEQPVPRDMVACMTEARPGTPDAWGVDFWIDDADAGATKAIAAGGAVIVPPFNQETFRRAVLTDPSGAVLSISQLLLDRVPK